MNALRSTWLVAEREIRQALRRRSFWIVIAVLMIGATAAVVVPELIGDSGRATATVVVVGDPDEFTHTVVALGDSIDTDITVVRAADRSAATALVDEGDAAVGVVLGDDPAVVVRSGQHDRLVGVVAQALAVDTTVEKLHAAGLTDAQIDEALNAPAPEIAELDTDGDARRGASFALSLVLYLLLLTVMAQVASASRSRRRTGSARSCCRS